MKHTITSPAIAARRALLALAALASPALAATMTIPLDAFIASGAYGGPLNSHAAPRVGAGAVVTSVAWNLTLTTSGQSRADESVLCLYAAGNPNAIIDVRPFECAHAPGVFSASHGPVSLGAVPIAGPNVWGAQLPLPNGFLYIEAWDMFDDLTAIADASFMGTITIDFTPPVCPADLDNGNSSGIPDGAVTIDDLIYFLRAFEDGTLSADLDDGTSTATPDQAVTIDDLIFMLIRFENGC